MFFLSTFICFGNDCRAEIETAESPEDKRAILNYLGNGIDSVITPIKPIVSGQEPEQGWFTGKWGPANFRLSTLRGLELSWDESDFLFRLGGRLYIDLTYYIEDKNNLGDNGLGVRTILVEMNGQFSKNWPYRLSWGGFTEGGKVNTSGVKVDDAFVRYLGFENMVLTLGQHTEPFSLEELTGSLNITFLERALPNAFALGTTLGISAAFGGDNWFTTGGFFSEQLTDFKDQGSQGYGVTGYFSISPIRNNYGAIHFGSSLSYRNVSDEKDVFFRSRPESGLTTVRYVNTGTILSTKSISRFGFDVAGIFGPWSFQSEYISTSVGRGDGFEDVNFNGWYAFFSWFVTGESRNYRDNGVFGSITPQNPIGAVELALRYSAINLNDADIKGGEEQNVTLGLNWYIHKQLRLMFNYIYRAPDLDFKINPPN